MNYLAAIPQTFYSKRFYADVIRTKPKRGFLYLLVVSFIAAILALLAGVFVIVPEMDKVIEWLKKDMPTLTWTGNGLAMKETSPYPLIHPEFGPLATFDTSRDEATPDVIQNMNLYVTRSNVYVNDGTSIRTYSLQEVAKKNPNLKEGIELNATVVDAIYQKTKKIVYAALFFGTLVVVYVWKLAVALIFSIPGLIFNGMRQNKISFQDIYDVCLYALTPATVFQIVRTTIPAISAIPFMSVLDISITLAFLYFAVKMSESETVIS